MPFVVASSTFEHAGCAELSVSHGGLHQLNHLQKQLWARDSLCALSAVAAMCLELGYSPMVASNCTLGKDCVSAIWDL